MKLFKLFAAVALLILAGVAYALSLSEAKSQGLVGEKGDGFIAAVPANVTSAQTTEVQSLVTSINQARLAEYQTIANNNGTSLSHVESVAGQTLLNMAKPGEYVMGSKGNWVKKPS